MVVSFSSCEGVVGKVVKWDRVQQNIDDLVWAKDETCKERQLPRGKQRPRVQESGP